MKIHKSIESKLDKEGLTMEIFKDALAVDMVYGDKKPLNIIEKYVFKNKLVEEYETMKKEYACSVLKARHKLGYNTLDFDL